MDILATPDHRRFIAVQHRPPALNDLSGETGEGEKVELEVRRVAVDDEKLHDTGEGRKEGFF